jgi:pimeloyl-ACP methyl ester carboxylesterase
MRIRTINLIAATFLALLTPLYAQAPTGPVRTGYAPVNGLKLYYEIRGSGDPLILIHGGVGGIAMFGNLPDTLARHRQVIAVELQGHGRTADIDRPFEKMADDIAALIKYLGISHADVMGYSLGGEVALQTAIRHPEEVRKLVLVSTTFSRNGWYPEVLAQFDHMGPAAAEGMKQSPLNQVYPNVNWVALFTKLGELERKPYECSAGVSSLKMQTLLIFADADAVRPEYIVQFYGLLGGGKRDAGLDGSGRGAAQLAIFPGATHYNIISSPFLARMVTNFLDGPAPAAM